MELLSVSPQQLIFYAPYNGPQRRTVTLLNPTHLVVLFKVRSNAYRHYRLKPNAGKVEPYATIEIRICLQCFDFDEDQEYNHYLNIQSFFKPDNSFNGETPLAIFRTVSRDQVYTKCLPIKLENKPLFLTKCGPEAPCLKQMILERGHRLKPVCPKCAVPSISKTCRRRGIKCMFIIIVCLLAVFILAYLLLKDIGEMVKNAYQNQCIHLDISQDSYLNSSSSSCICSSSEFCNTPDSCISPEISGVNLT
ncbi:uncharacterized protein LOC110182291 [Drosophila serrata]|uniref:uncharacterized protein LOC110182291 n=1 Tax=Drosophila serrata TaxID=7274 RepID=UPI000A1CF7EA|nr:uncharacterized protein LOC110182291 [Drosophila serrata]